MTRGVKTTYFTPTLKPVQDKKSESQELVIARYARVLIYESAISRFNYYVSIANINTHIY